MNNSKLENFKLNKKYLTVFAALAVIIILIAVIINTGRKTDNPNRDTSKNPQDTAASVEDTDAGEVFNDMYVEIAIDISDDDLFLLHETPDDSNYYEADITIDGNTLKRAGIRIKGKNNSEEIWNSGSDKYSFKLDMNEFNKGQTFKKIKAINLDNMLEDSSFLASYTAYRLLSKLEAVTPYFSLASVTVNDEASQWYFASEEIDNAFVERFTGDDGDICLFEASSKNAVLDSKDSAENYEIKYGKDQSESYLNKLIDVINDKNSTAEDIEKVLDTDSVLKAMAVNYVVGNYGSYQGQSPDNFYLLYDNGIFYYFEKNFSCAGGNYETDKGLSINVTSDTPLYRINMKDRPLVNKLLSIDVYNDKYTGYVNELLEYLKTDKTIINDGISLLGDYADSDEFKDGLEQLEKYLYR